MTWLSSFLSFPLPPFNTTHTHTFSHTHTHTHSQDLAQRHLPCLNRRGRQPTLFTTRHPLARGNLRTRLVRQPKESLEPLVEGGNPPREFSRQIFPGERLRRAQQPGRPAPRTRVTRRPFLPLPTCGTSPLAPRKPQILPHMADFFLAGTHPLPSSTSWARNEEKTTSTSPPTGTVIWR
jgi:hypothetical protein